MQESFGWHGLLQEDGRCQLAPLREESCNLTSSEPRGDDEVPPKLEATGHCSSHGGSCPRGTGLVEHCVGPSRKCAAYRSTGPKALNFLHLLHGAPIAGPC
ncbi:hypothetical protein NDU88_002376 [Pleurodeles waltl]|uniref:Uncharacterized protein n=1 Tax=Pleurodeles waltl TaxID=8319 RepID=A0AAV7NHU0_PLEWA|nr:hypothetical protein NDU88_002376 [Pleurodeles waltl]